MCSRGDPGHDSQADVEHERPADGQAAQEIVEAVAHEDEIRDGLPTVSGGPVAVVVVQELLCREEHREAQHRPGESPERVPPLAERAR